MSDNGVEATDGQSPEMISIDEATEDQSPEPPISVEDATEKLKTYYESKFDDSLKAHAEYANLIRGRLSELLDQKLGSAVRKNEKAYLEAGESISDGTVMFTSSIVTTRHREPEVYFGSTGRVGDVLSFNPTVEWQIDSRDVIAG